MNQLYFEGTITNLYSVDYQYLQDSLTTEMKNLIKMLISVGTQSSVAYGFVAEVSSSDRTKILINHEGLVGTVVSATRLIVESTSNIDAVALSSYTLGMVNNIYCRCYKALASYNRLTELIVEQARVIDESNNTVVYDRNIDKSSIVVYTNSEYAALTQDQKDELVFLGSTIAQGVGQPLLSVDRSAVDYITIGIADNSISINKINPSVQIPQDMIYNTSTGDIDDHYYGSSTGVDVKDDLNYIRTMIRDIKETTNWDDTLINVKESTPEIDSLFKQGIFPDYLNEFDIVITSSGTAVSVQSGFALLGNAVKEILTSTGIVLPVNTDYRDVMYTVVVTSSGVTGYTGSLVGSAAWTTNAGWNLNTARYGLAGAGIQNAALSFGGNGSTSFSSVTEKFDGLDWTASAGWSLNTARYLIAGCGIQNAALSFGGDTGSVSQVTESFDGSTWKNKTEVPLITARGGLGGCGIKNAALSFGGNIGSFVATTESFNGFFWKTEGDLNIIRYLPGGCGSVNAAICFGGFDGSVSVDSTETFNGSSWVNSAAVLSVISRALAGAGTGYIALSFGGESVSAVTEMFNSLTWRTNSNWNLNTGRNSLAGCGTQSLALSFGGDTGLFSSTTEKFIITSKQESYLITEKNTFPIYDIKLKHLSSQDSYESFSVWTTDAAWNLQTERGWLAGCGIQNTALSFGGIDPAYSATTEKFNIDTWTVSGNLNTAKSYLAGCGIQNAALSFGGRGASGISAVTESFNGTLWVTASSMNLHAATRYLAGSGIVSAALMFGGYNTSPSGITEKYNGAVWTTDGSWDLNAPRYNLAGCGIQSAALSLGGNDDASAVSTTEKFNGSVWSTNSSWNLNTAQEQLAGCGIQAAAVAMGGFNQDGVVIEITQEFNGSVWSASTDLNVPRFDLAGCGMQGAALCFGGDSPHTATEKYTLYTNSYIVASDIVDIRQYRVPIREVTEIQSTDLTSYDSLGNFHPLHYYALYKLAVVNTISGLLVQKGTTWNVTTKNGYSNVFTLTSTGTLQTIIHTQDDDELYIEYFATSTGSTVVKVDYATSTGLYDKTVYVTLPKIDFIGYAPQVFLLEKGFLLGYHKVKISSVTNFDFRKFIIGKLDTYYNKDNSNFNTEDFRSTNLKTHDLYITGLLSSNESTVHLINVDKLDGAEYSTDGTFFANSDVLISTQKATKTWIDDRVLEYSIKENNIYNEDSFIVSIPGTIPATLCVNNLHSQIVQYTWTTNSTWNVNIARYSAASGGAGTINAALFYTGVDSIGNYATTEKFTGYSWTTTPGWNMLDQKQGVGGCGIQNAALCFGGFIAAVSKTNHMFNGNSWKVSGSLSEDARYLLTGSGIQNAAMAIGGDSGGPTAVDTVERFDGAAWALDSYLIAGRYELAGCGTQHAALCFGGSSTGLTKITEKYINGVGWLITGTPNVARARLGGCGIQNSALAFDGFVSDAYSLTEKFDGFVWRIFGSNCNVPRYSHSGCGSSEAALSVGGATSGPLESAVTEKFIGVIQQQISLYVQSSTGAAYVLNDNLICKDTAYTILTYPPATFEIGTVPQVWQTQNEYTELKILGRDNLATGLVWSTDFSWNLNTASYAIGCGTQAAALSFGESATGVTTEKFDGISWTTGIYWNLGTPRTWLAGCGIQSAALGFGGGTGATALVTEKFDGSSWSTDADWNLIIGRNTLSGCGIQNAALNFGGSSTGITNITESFDGSSWSTTGNLNTARCYSSGCGIQNAAKSLGGFDGSSVILDSIENFNGSTWAVAESLNVARLALAGCGTQNSALNFGGETAIAGSICSGITEIFNGWTWLTSGDLNTARYGMGGCGTQSAALSFGGYSNGALVTITEKFNKINNTTYSGVLYTSSDLSIPRQDMAGAGVQSAALCFGGWDVEDGYTYIDTTESFNGLAWSTTGDIITERHSLSGCGTQLAALSFCGWTSSGLNYSGVTEKFNVDTWTTSPGWNLNIFRESAAGCGIQSTAMSFGGNTSTGYVTETESFNGSVWYVVSGDALTPRQDLAGCGVHGAALSFGGNTGSLSAVTEKFNGVDWSASGNLNRSRDKIAGCGLQNTAICFGGDIGSGINSADTEKFNGYIWSMSPVWSISVARYGAASCGTPGSALLFGGYAVATSGVTEKFNAVTEYTTFINSEAWSVSSGLNVGVYGLAGAGIQSAALSFGGRDGSTYSATTEKFNGSTWSSGSWNITPARTQLAGCGVQNAALCFGGYDGSNSQVTEKFNGLTWTNITTAPLMTARRRLAGCGIQSAALSFGGSGYLTTTEKFDGTSWAATGGLNTGCTDLAGIGLQNAAVSFGGYTGVSEDVIYSIVTELFNGSTWAMLGSLNIPRNTAAGSGIQNAALSFGGDDVLLSGVTTESFNGSYWITSASWNLNTDRTSLAGAGTQAAALSFGGASTALGATEKFNSSTTTFDVKQVDTWFISGDLNTAKLRIAGCGTQNAALCFGGYIISGDPTEVTEIFNGLEWFVTGDLNTARYALAGCGVQNAALSFGGTTGSNSQVTEKFNGSTWTNITATPLMTARSYLAGCGIQNAALSFGGEDSVDLLSTTEKFNGVAWSTSGNLTTIKSYAAGCGVQNAALSFGGNVGYASPEVVEKFNGNVWTVTGNLNTVRNDLAGCGIQGVALAFGGNSGSAILATVEKFNGILWSSNALWNLNIARYSLAGAGMQSSALGFGGFSDLGYWATTEKFISGSSVDYNIFLPGTEKFTVDYVIDYTA